MLLVDTIRSLIGFCLSHQHLLPLLLLIIYLSFKKWATPLRKIPGPLLASACPLWKLYHAFRGDMEQANILVHRKYGPIVRIAPHEVSIDDPKDSLKIIYGHGTQFTKSRWYEASDAPGSYSLFTDPDIARHAHDRRMVANGFSMTALLEMESLVDDCVKVFESRLDDFVESRQVIDLGHWLQCYAFDVIGQITFSKRFGFLDKGNDIGGMMKTLDGFLSYSAKMGMIPSLHGPYTKLLGYVTPKANPLETVRKVCYLTCPLCVLDC
jgi:hypothetical protein